MIRTVCFCSQFISTTLLPLYPRLWSRSACLLIPSSYVLPSNAPPCLLYPRLWPRFNAPLFRLYPSLWLCSMSQFERFSAPLSCPLELPAAPFDSVRGCGSFPTPQTVCSRRWEPDSSVSWQPVGLRTIVSGARVGPGRRREVGRGASSGRWAVRLGW